MADRRDDATATAGLLGGDGPAGMVAVLLEHTFRLNDLGKAFDANGPSKPANSGVTPDDTAGLQDTIAKNAVPKGNQTLHRGLPSL